MKKWDELVGMKQAAELLGCAPPTLYNWVKKGKVPYYRHKITGRIRFDPDELRALVENPVEKIEATSEMERIGRKKTRGEG